MKKYAKEFGWVLLTAWVICLPIEFVDDSADAAPIWYKALKTIGSTIIPAGIGFLFIIARKNRPEGRLKTAIIITAVVSICVCYSTMLMLNRISAESTNENPYNAVVEQEIKEGAIKVSTDGHTVLVAKPEPQNNGASAEDIAEAHKVANEVMAEYKKHAVEADSQRAWEIIKNAPLPSFESVNR